VSLDQLRQVLHQLERVSTGAPLPRHAPRAISRRGEQSLQLLG
jgi:hypothetical protein